MAHLSTELLQRYLAGDLDLDETARAEAHLAGCSACETLLAAVAADDALLADALALTPEEAAWVGAQDLRPAVLRKLVPWFLQPQGLILLLALLAPAGWMLNQTAGLMQRTLVPQGPVGLTLTVLETLGRLGWSFVKHVGTSGPLAALLPLVIVAAATLWISRRKNVHA